MSLALKGGCRSGHQAVLAEMGLGFLGFLFTQPLKVKLVDRKPCLEDDLQENSPTDERLCFLTSRRLLSGLGSIYSSNSVPCLDLDLASRVVYS